MPWLVVLGEGTWAYTRGREWEDGPWQPPPGGPEGRTGRWKYDVLTFKGAHGPYRVDDDVVEAARATGYSWLVVREEEPYTESVVPSGTLSPEDVREGTGPVGMQIVDPIDQLDQLDQPEEEPTPSSDDFSPLLHGCPLCPAKWPTQARLDRHIEFHHPDVHGNNLAEVVAAHEAMRAQEDELRRMRDHQGPLRPEDREQLGEE